MEMQEMQETMETTETVEVRTQEAVPEAEVPHRNRQ